MEKDRQFIELAIVGINYSITRHQRRIARAAQYLDEILKGKPTKCEKSLVELQAIIFKHRDKIKELEELKYELEMALSE